MRALDTDAVFVTTSQKQKRDKSPEPYLNHELAMKGRGSILNVFQEFIQTIPATHREVKRWEFKDGMILENGDTFDPGNYRNEFAIVLRYFQEWQTYANLEAQVLLVTQEDYESYYTHFPVLPNPYSSVKIVVLPQENTPVNTIVREQYWHKTVKGDPIMRIHSHHEWSAYQSATDFSCLNSGTLEVVFGKIDNEPEIAYWLTRHSDITTKEHVFYGKLPQI